MDSCAAHSIWNNKTHLIFYSWDFHKSVWGREREREEKTQKTRRWARGLSVYISPCVMVNINNQRETRKRGQHTDSQLLVSFILFKKKEKRRKDFKGMSRCICVWWLATDRLFRLGWWIRFSLSRAHTHTHSRYKLLLTSRQLLHLGLYIYTVYKKRKNSAGWRIQEWGLVWGQQGHFW